MVMNRRKFIGLLAVAPFAKDAIVRMAGKLPIPFLRGRKNESYPGPVKPLDENSIRKMGRWQG